MKSKGTSKAMQSKQAPAKTSVSRDKARKMRDDSHAAKKIGKITKYETKSYVGHARILDLDRSASPGDTLETPAAKLEEAHEETPPPLRSQ